MTTYRFTRSSDGAYVVTVPTNGGTWRKLDGSITTHAGGRVVCCDFAEPVDLAQLQRAFAAWLLAGTTTA